jgi:APA family basic amino acid/polyamine antiporter
LTAIVLSSMESHDTTLHVMNTATPPVGLKRALGRWDLTAIGVNQVIGGAIFAMPAVLAARTGAWSVWLIVLVGAASLLVAASFAEVGSRFDSTGGPYVYTRRAFGRFLGFEVGWMQWFTRVASWASVINVLVSSLGFYWPDLTAGADRLLLMAVIIAVLAGINIIGIQQSAWVVNGLTIGKLAPLALFIIVGLPAIDTARLHSQGALSLSDAAGTALLLIFTFGGYEVIPVPAGETRDPRRAIPFALIATIATVTLIFGLAQVVALGTLPGLAGSKTPLADAAALFMGSAGAALITLGAVVSTLGNNMGQALSGSRMLFALAEEGDLPAFVGRVHPRFRTPVNAILITAAVSFALAATGTFVTMAAASAVSRLFIYFFTCAAALRLRTSGPAPFRLPLGPLIPLGAIAIVVMILVEATSDQKLGGVVTLAVGAVFFAAAAIGAGRPLRQS